MILIEKKSNATFRFKVRTKGAPSYAETGDNRKVTVDGKAVNFVLNPKKENNTSKRVGFAWDGKWYFVDDAETHKFVKALNGKVVTAFTQKQRSEKTAATAETKAVKGKGKEKETAKAAPKSKKTKEVKASKAAAPSAKAPEKPAVTPAESAN